MTSLTGRRLAHYEILDKLGQGGMGEVYRARDTSLDREVAIKLLPEHFSQDPQRLARFEREAKLLGSLNHGNIAAVYGLHLEGEHRFLAMELVPGNDLAHTLAQGPLPVDEALAIAAQVAEALETAHANGIVHRDLKPANIMVTPEGKAKVLDFGLAKSADPEGPDSSVLLTQSPTLTAGVAASHQTVSGSILGTAAYMSPEQARGKPTDGRTDIWAFGCVLYEMLTGTAPFSGETLTDSIAAIIHTEVDFGKLPENLPPGARHVLRRCLTRDRDLRQQSMGDVRVELTEARTQPQLWESVTGMPAAPVAPSPANRARSALGVLAVAAAGVLGFVLAVVFGVGGSSPEPVEPRTIEIPIADLDNSVIPCLSPDGEWIAFIRNDELWIRSTRTLTERKLQTAGRAYEMAWSPDSRSVAYHTVDAMYRSGIDGGDSQLVCDLPTNWVRGAGLTWTDRGILFAQGSSGLQRVPETGGAIETILEQVPDGEHFHRPSPLPGGLGYVYASHGSDGDVVLEALLQGERRELHRAPGVRLEEPIWSPTGHILYRRETDNPGIWALPVSGPDLGNVGQPFRVVANGYSASVDAHGNLFQIIGRMGVNTQGAWVDTSGRVVERVDRPFRGFENPRLSPDGTRIAAARAETGSPDVWVLDLVRGGWSRVTFSEEPDFDPVWLPDSRSLLYAHLGTVLKADITGSRDHEYVATLQSHDVDRNGRWLVGLKSSMGSGPDVWAFDLTTGDSLVVVGTEAREGSPRISPDGRYLLYPSDESGRAEIYLTTMPTADKRWQVSVDGGNWPQWSPDGRTIYFESAESVYRVRFAEDPEVVLSTPEYRFAFANDLEYVSDFSMERGLFLGVARAQDEDDIEHPIRITLGWAQSLDP